jgi:hypothetical protein
MGSTTNPRNEVVHVAVNLLIASLLLALAAPDDLVNNVERLAILHRQQTPPPDLPNDSHGQTHPNQTKPLPCAQ